MLYENFDTQFLTVNNEFCMNMFKLLMSEKGGGGLTPEVCSLRPLPYFVVLIFKTETVIINIIAYLF